MIKAILIDDEPRGLNSLRKMLDDYCPQVKIVAECMDAESALEKIKLSRPQLLFLDISLPGKNGFDLLTEIEEINSEIIFITAHSEYMLNAFRYSAIDYLMKPIDEDLLVEAVKRAEKKISASLTNNNIQALLYNLQKNSSPKEMRLCISSLKGFQVVELKDVIYCEATSAYTNFYFTDKTIVCSSKNIHEYEELLADAGFVRIHKSHMINLLHVKEYKRGEGGAIILSSGQELEVSRRRKDFFINKMKQYYKF